jgi:ABC-2 type transport system permease protein
MTPFLGILRKELKIAFTTPIAYVVFFFFTLLSSLVFYDQLLEYEKQVQKSRHLEDAELLQLLNFNDIILTHLFVSVQLIFVFLIPILTMRMIAEERRHRTMELLMTTPISPWQVVAGKYLAYLAVLGCMCGLVTVYPVILSIFGTNTLVGVSVIDWPTTLLGILGVFLTGAMFGAVGFAFSSVTESQVVAALLTLFGLLLLWFVARVAEEAPGWLGETLVFISPLSHMASFARGILHLGDVLYYVTVGFFFLFFTHRMVEGQRWR